MENTPQFEALRKEAVGTNINETTLLATDYMNHFNEVMMLIELVPDMPEMMEEVRAWRPKSYQDHFRDSTFKHKDLAVRAYGAIPDRYRKPFEAAVAGMHEVILSAIPVLTRNIAAANDARTRFIVEEATKALRLLSGILDGIINGSGQSLTQSEIDTEISGR